MMVDSVTSNVLAEYEAVAMTSLSLPPAPKSIGETGLSEQFLQRLVLKTMHVIGSETLSQISEQTKLSESILDQIIEKARDLDLIIPMGSSEGGFLSEMRFNLSSKGTAWAEEALAMSQYVGPCPVTLADYSAMVEQQSITNERIGAEVLAKSFQGVILPHEVFLRLGPALNSGKSILLYGKPGNGKTFVAERMGRAYQQSINVPHAVEVDGQVIKLYDNSVHTAVNPGSESALRANATGLSHEPSPLRKPTSGDTRWVRCNRPVIITGGELTLDMLDLRYNDSARFYEAPLQMKAMGGIFVIDDFGRQRTSAHSILNRWIVPLERRIDYLTLHSGKKFQIPFDELVIFSTNIQPTDLGDDALLRRLYHKIEIPLPSDKDFETIFRDVCDANNVVFDPAIIDFLETQFYAKTKTPRSGYHPIFLMDQVKALCGFSGEPLAFTERNLEMAWANIVVTDIQ